jgi:hypothetical protein
MKKIISFLLLLVVLVGTFAACGEGDDDGGTTAPGTTAPGTTNPGTTAPSTTTDIWVDSIGPEVRALAEEQRSLKFEMGRLTNAELDAMTDIYMANGEEMGTSSIEQLIWERNKAAEELLGVTMTYDYCDADWGNVAASVANNYNGKNAPDMYVNMIFDLTFATLSGYFRDVKTMDGYFDFTHDSWLNDYMMDLSIGQDRIYLLASYYFIDMFRAMFVVPFNMDLMDANVERLKNIITQEELAASEKLSPYFFELIQEGKWTHDVLTAICENIWKDNGTVENADDIDDVLGFVADCSWGYSSSGLLYSNKIDITEETKDENGMVIAITYPTTPNETLVKVFNEVAELFNANGALALNQGAAAITKFKQKFAEGTLLFGSGVLLGAIASEEYQQMSDQFSVVPMPAIEASAEGEDLPYATMIHNRGNVGAINVMSTKYKVVSAFVQYVSENSEHIYDEYLNVTIKFDDFSGNAGTSAMLDIIYDSIRSNREKVIDDVLHTKGWGKINDYRWHMLLMANGYTQYGNDGILPMYETSYKKKMSYLEAVLSDWANNAISSTTPSADSAN